VQRSVDNSHKFRDATESTVGSIICRIKSQVLILLEVRTIVRFGLGGLGVGGDLAYEDVGGRGEVG
jgi:hypothetical protein